MLRKKEVLVQFKRLVGDELAWRTQARATSAHIANRRRHRRHRRHHCCHIPLPPSLDCTCLCGQGAFVVRGFCGQWVL
eukprot:4124010-Prymnesium_polylepis.1